MQYLWLEGNNCPGGAQCKPGVPENKKYLGQERGIEGYNYGKCCGLGFIELPLDI